MSLSVETRKFVGADMRQLQFNFDGPKIWTKQMIQDLLRVNPRMVVRSLMVLYQRQTDLEKSTKLALMKNNAGFNNADAEFLTSLAKQVIGGRALSPKQISFASKALMKYHRQLVQIANQRERGRYAEGIG